MAEIILEVKDLSKRFGGIVALDGVNFSVEKGCFLGIIGPNGAGKTTLFNVITGVYPESSGKVYLLGEDLGKFKAYERARKGILRSFQQTNIFSKLKVMENMLQGFHTAIPLNFWMSLFPTNKSKRLMEEKTVQALEILKFLGLEQFSHHLAGSLPLGIQKKIGIALALVAGPKVLLLDEPVAGLNSGEIDGVMHFINDIVRKKCTCIIIEHHVKTVMHYCDRLLVLHFGKKIAEGLPEEVRNNRDVVVAYLGEEE
jgi:branched-chain amino acid transport system ATP-binding protein